MDFSLTNYIVSWFASGTEGRKRSVVVAIDYAKSVDIDPAAARPAKVAGVGVAVVVNRGYHQSLLLSVNLPQVM